MSDLEVEAAGSGLVHIIASSEPAAGLLRMFCSPTSPASARKNKTRSWMRRLRYMTACSSNYRC
jgi:hypothetical protein